MKIIVQTVKYAICKDNIEQAFSIIGYGLVLYVGVSKTDTDETLDYLANKILKLKLFDGWNKTVPDNNFDLLVLFEKSLSDDLIDLKSSKGLTTSEAKEIFTNFYSKLKMKYKHGIVRRGFFDEQFSIILCNQGPSTFILNK